MSEVLQATAVLAIVVIGLLVIVQLISPGDALKVLVRGAVAAIVAVLACYGLAMLWTRLVVPWFSTGFALLKSSLVWLAITFLVLSAVLIAGQLIFKQFVGRFPISFGSQKGHKYGKDDH